MSDHANPPQRRRYKVVIIEMVVGDEANNCNDAALDSVKARGGQLRGDTASADIVDADIPLIEPDAHRDHEAEQRIADRVREPLNKIVSNASARDHLRRAGEELSEAALLTSIEMLLRADQMLREAMTGAALLWQKYTPSGEEVTRDLIKELIKLAIFFTLVQVGVKLTS